MAAAPDCAAGDERLRSLISDLTRVSISLGDLATQLNSMAASPPSDMQPMFRMDIATLAHQCNQVVLGANSMACRLRAIDRGSKGSARAQ